MPIYEPPLTSVQNPRVKAWAKLSERKHRNQEGRFLLEGVHLVKEALNAGWPLEAIVFDEGFGVPAELELYVEREEQRRQGGLILVGAADTIASVDGHQQVVPSWVPVSPDIIAKCTETESPQPIFAVALKCPADEAKLFGEGVSGADAGVEGTIAGRGPVVVLDGVQDPGNVGTIIRSAAASGASAIVLGKGTADLYNAKTLRSTMGTLFRVPTLEADLTALLPEARWRGAVLYGTSLQATESCYECDLSGMAGQPWLLFGNEGSGLSPEAEALVDRRIIIPMTGGAESLNVAMAATVLLFEAQRQRLLSTNNNSCS